MSTQDRPYSIEYVPPGIVRAGENHLTDYVLVYREDGVALYFVCVGQRNADGHVSYFAEMAPEIHWHPALYERRRTIVQRLKAHLEGDSFLHMMHGDTTFAP